jgi:Fe2+ transport system protein FeoA
LQEALLQCRFPVYRNPPTTDGKPPTKPRLESKATLTHFGATVNTPLHGCQAADDCPHGELCPLSKVAVGASVRVRHLTTSPETSQRLREMGFCEDQTVRLVSRQSNIICQVCNARLGLSMELAEKILVQHVPKKAA